MDRVRGTLSGSINVRNLLVDTLAGAIQALNFAQFIALWLGLALYLTAPPMGYGTDTVGYLAGLAAVSIASTPWLGRWSDTVGPRTARTVSAPST